MTGDDQPVHAERDFESLRAIIARAAARLPKRLMQVAGYALENPDEIAFGTVASIAAAADVQPSTLVRFSRALGYQGFTDLQEVFRSRLRDRVLNYDERLAQMREHGIATSKSGLVLDGFLEAGATLDRRNSAKRSTTRRSTGRSTCSPAADTIYLIGLRRSFPITSYMSYAMGKLGDPQHPGRCGRRHGRRAGELHHRRSDAALAISFTPYASETVALTDAAKARGAKIVTITDSVFSPIASPGRRA